MLAMIRGEEPSEWPSSFPELKEIDNLLRCGVCYEFIQTAMMVPTCSHNYCSLCIRRYMSFKTECPTCRVNVTDLDLKNNRLLDEIVAKFSSVRNPLLELLTKEPKNKETESKNNPQICQSAIQGDKKLKQNEAKSRKKSKRIISDDEEYDDEEFVPPPRSARKKSRYFQDSDSDTEEEDVICTKGDAANTNQSNSSKVLHAIKSPPAQCFRNKKDSVYRYQNTRKDEPVGLKRSLTDSSVLTQEARQTETSTSGLSDLNRSISGSGSPSSSASSVVKKVNCPVCSVPVTEKYINLHLDRCLNSPPPQQARTSVAVPKRKQLPKLVYNLMKDNDIRKRLSEHGLSTQGDRRTLIKRHQEFTLLYNTQCDSLNPKSAQEIVRDMQKSTAAAMFKPSTSRQAMNNCLVIEKGASADKIENAQKQYLKEHKSQFDQLIAETKARMKRRKEEMLRKQKEEQKQKPKSSDEINSEKDETTISDENRENEGFHHESKRGAASSYIDDESTKEGAKETDSARDRDATDDISCGSSKVDSGDPSLRSFATSTDRFRNLGQGSPFTDNDLVSCSKAETGASSSHNDSKISTNGSMNDRDSARFSKYSTSDSTNISKSSNKPDMSNYGEKFHSVTSDSSNLSDKSYNSSHTELSFKNYSSRMNTSDSIRTSDFKESSRLGSFHSDSSSRDMFCDDAPVTPTDDATSSEHNRSHLSMSTTQSYKVCDDKACSDNDSDKRVLDMSSIHSENVSVHSFVISDKNSSDAEKLVRDSFTVEKGDQSSHEEFNKGELSTQASSEASSENLAWLSQTTPLDLDGETQTTQKSVDWPQSSSIPSQENGEEHSRETQNDIDCSPEFTKSSLADNKNSHTLINYTNSGYIESSPDVTENSPVFSSARKEGESDEAAEPQKNDTASFALLDASDDDLLLKDSGVATVASSQETTKHETSSQEIVNQGMKSNQADDSKLANEKKGKGKFRKVMSSNTKKGKRTRSICNSPIDEKEGGVDTLTPAPLSLGFEPGVHESRVEDQQSQNDFESRDNRRRSKRKRISQPIEVETEAKNRATNKRVRTRQNDFPDNDCNSSNKKTELHDEEKHQESDELLARSLQEEENLGYKRRTSRRIIKNKK